FFSSPTSRAASSFPFPPSTPPPQPFSPSRLLFPSPSSCRRCNRMTTAAYLAADPLCAVVFLLCCSQATTSPPIELDATTVPAPASAIAAVTVPRRATAVPGGGFLFPLLCSPELAAAVSSSSRRRVGECTRTVQAD
ncbi:hypothetical protein Tsubulata_036947, partial [Turnera subulata]